MGLKKIILLSFIMAKKLWLIIGLALNLIVLAFSLLWQENIFILILLTLGVVFSITLFFKDNKLLKLLVLIVPLFSLVMLFVGLFSGVTSSVDVINGSVKDRVNNLFNNS